MCKTWRVPDLEGTASCTAALVGGAKTLALDPLKRYVKRGCFIYAYKYIMWLQNELLLLLKAWKSPE